MTCPPTNLFLAWSISLNYFYSKVSVSTLLSLRLNIFDPPISRLDGWQNPNSGSKNIHVLEVYSKPKLGFGSQCGYFDLPSDLNTVCCDISVSSTESRVLSVWELWDLMGASVHLVWETAPMDPLKFHSGCARVQWGFFIAVVLLLTWRHREFGPLTEAKVQEIPLLHGVLIVRSLLPVFHAAPSHFLEITSPLILPLYLLSPHDENMVWVFFSPWMGKPGQACAVVFCTKRI